METKSRGLLMGEVSRMGEEKSRLSDECKRKKKRSRARRYLRERAQVEWVCVTRAGEDKLKCGHCTCGFSRSSPPADSYAGGCGTCSLDTKWCPIIRHRRIWTQARRTQARKGRWIWARPGTETGRGLQAGENKLGPRVAWW
jgi:hypothetical protein